MRIAVVGTGAMGSVYAGLLADAGNEVWAIDTWVEHVETIRRPGLRVEGASGDRTVRLHATTRPGRGRRLRSRRDRDQGDGRRGGGRAARPLVGTTPSCCTIQNGLGQRRPRCGHPGCRRVAVGVAGGFGASIRAPGHVHHNGWELIRLGELRGPAGTHRAAAEVWREPASLSSDDDIDQLVWEKLVCNVTFSGTCAVLERTIGEVLADDEAWSVASRCAVEADAVARARGVRLGYEEPVAYVRAFGERIPNARPSMLLDLLAGRRCEIDVLNGAVPGVAREVGLEAPTNETVAALVSAKQPR